MIRRFLGDRRGNYALLTAITVIPLMGGLALGVDYTDLLRQKQDALNALDAAGIATAQQIVAGATDNVAKAYAKNFFEANLSQVKAANTVLTVTLPNNNVGGGTLKLCAALTFHPYFLPAAAMLIGRTATDTSVSACSEVRLKNTLEVSLVLDNSGSMSTKGVSNGSRIDLLKSAATELVNTLALQAQQMKQISKPVQFALVPFSASVNVGAPLATDPLPPWLDGNGISPIHHENFDWSKMSKTAGSPGYNVNKYIENVGGVYWKRGSGWGTGKYGQDTRVTRFSLYEHDITAQTCTKKQNGVCKTSVIAPYQAWKGCVEARPYPYNDDDTPPTTGDPASLFVPMFAPDEPGNLFLDINLDGKADLTSYSPGYTNSWWADAAEGLTAVKRQADMRKYFYTKPWDAAAEPNDGGPNSACTTSPITPLQDVTTSEGLATITTAIGKMTPTGNTNVPEGLAWGWRTLSHGEPFTTGRPDTERGNDKVVIVLTDGANTYSPFADATYANNQSTYAAYGYTGLKYALGSVTRMFMNTSVPKTTYTDANYTAALDEQMQTLCTNAKNAKVMVITVSLDLSTTKTADKKAIAALTACASFSRFRKDPTDPTGKTAAKLFYNASSATLSQVFKEIASELSNLRIVS